jgi:hypothetical protein
MKYLNLKSIVKNIYYLLLIPIFTVGLFNINLVFSPGILGFPGNIERLLKWINFQNQYALTYPNLNDIQTTFFKYTLIISGLIIISSTLYILAKNKKYFHLLLALLMFLWSYFIGALQNLFLGNGLY